MRGPSKTVEDNRFLFLQGEQPRGRPRSRKERLVADVPDVLPRQERIVPCVPCAAALSCPLIRMRKLSPLPVGPQ